MAILAGIVCLFLGALPFLVIEELPGSDGASFIIFAWMLIGPPVCFAVMPIAYFLSLDMTPRQRSTTYPAVASVAVALFLWFSAPAGSQITRVEMLFIVLLLSAIWGTWAIYVLMRDAMRK